MPYFFLSYANADSDPYMERFYSDLCDAVRRRTGYSSDEIGYRDTSRLQLGEDWPDSLSTALAECRVFVALCSPSYFASDICGKEWQLFSEYARARGSGRPSTLLPIVWARSDVVPPIVQRLQTSHEELGEVYRREGLHYLMRLRRFRDQYRVFVVKLAERIVEAGRAHVPLPHPPAIGLLAIPSAFVPESSSPQPAVSTGNWSRGSGVPADTAPTTFVPTSRGPSHVNFVVVAAPSYVLSRIRSDLQFYGPRAYDWAPYKPDSTQRICVFAQSIASKRDLTSALETAERTVVDLLSRAREQNEIVVLLVDIWTATLDPYNEVLAQYDGINAPTSAVMVPWSTTDRELGENVDHLHDVLRATFPNNLARRDTVFRTGIETIADFERTLEELLAEAQARIFKVGRVAKRAGGDRVVPRPILTPLDQDPTQ